MLRRTADAALRDRRIIATALRQLSSRADASWRDAKCATVAAALRDAGNASGVNLKAFDATPWRHHGVGALA